MHEEAVIALENVTKVYRLYGSVADRALDILGLAWLVFWRRPRYAEFRAIEGVTLKIKKGERLGIIGRNGAGKTTLLKVICGRFGVSSGMIEVRGKVQALMSTGLGFHPEFTGHQNIRSALMYNGLPPTDLKSACQDVIEFVELGEFLHQPMKTYSLGMQTRLMFAAATAIKPDILIVDEILSAGDAYFSAKAVRRMEKLTRSGCTLLLVSHSMQQILQFCHRAIWIEAGKIVMDSDPLSVVKAYEEYIEHLEWRGLREAGARKSVLDDDQFSRDLLERTLDGKRDAASAQTDGPIARGGLSRWPGEKGLKITAVQVLDENGCPSSVLRTGKAASFEMEVVAEEDGHYRCRYNFYVFTPDGKALARHCSEEDRVFLKQGQTRVVRMDYPAVLLGNGEYICSAGVYKHLDLANLSSTVRYDVLARSFQFKVVDVYRDDATLFHHPTEWTFPPQAHCSIKGVA